jgi:hypothetical protein
MCKFCTSAAVETELMRLFAMFPVFVTVAIDGESRKVAIFADVHCSCDEENVKQLESQARSRN